MFDLQQKEQISITTTGAYSEYHFSSPLQFLYISFTASTKKLLIQQDSNLRLFHLHSQFLQHKRH